MRKSRFTDEQMVAMLREADRTSVAETARKHKVNEQTIYVWRKHFAGLAPADVKRLKALELENAKLKRLLAERDLEVDITRGEPKKMVSPPARREQIGFVREHGLSQRLACGLLGIGRSIMGYCRANPPPPTIDITRSPGSKRVAPGPFSATSPASSRPGISCGEPGGAG